jgi:hypothetical protein
MINRRPDADWEAIAKVSPPSSDGIDITLCVNGREHQLYVEPRVSLLDVLRERLG